MMKPYWMIIAICSTSAVFAQTVASAPSTYQQSISLKSSPELDALLHQKEEEPTLRPYDLVSIETYHADALNRVARIDQDGSMDLPIVGRVELEGLTSSKASQMIARSYEDHSLVLSPIVTVTVLESPSRVITVTGEVGSPGLYPVIGSNNRKESSTQTSSSTPINGIRTLGQLISAAGGLKDTASNVVTLIRPSLSKPLTIILSSDPSNDEYSALPLYAGDELRVAHIGTAYVVGAVKKQGAIMLKNFSPTSVAEAVAMSDGIGYEASADDAKLVRTQGTVRVLIAIPVRKILEGRVADIALQNDDILYIPTNKTKAAIKGGAAGLIVSLASTYIYAHP
jgi:polysaccharide export outer membrane protein